MIIDGHAHACGDYVTAESIVRTLDAAGVDRAVLSPGEPGSRRSYALPDLASRWPGRNFIYMVNPVIRFAVAATRKATVLPAGNEAVARLREAAPGRILQCYWVDPRRPDALAVLDRRFGEWHFAMAKLHQCWTPFDPAGRDVEAIADWCGSHGLPLFAHLYGRRDVTRFLWVCRRHPGTSFILGHLVGVEDMGDVESPQNNVLFDMSPPQLVGADAVLSAVRRFGVERVIMGSDTPYGKGNLRRAVDRVASMPLSSADKSLIMGGNLSRLLHL